MKTQRDQARNRAAPPVLFVQLVCLTAILLGGGGCTYFDKAALRRSELYYKATSLERLPPKPETEPIPFLDRVPKGGRVIGVFQFGTDRGRDFAMRSIEHNARKAGADAVWVRGRGEGRFPQEHYAPAHWESRQFTRLEQRRYTVPGGPGKPPRVVCDTLPVTGYTDVFVPAQRWTTIIQYNTVDALMLKLR
jgi:hypothetical protein